VISQKGKSGAEVYRGIRGKVPLPFRLTGSESTHAMVMIRVKGSKKDILGKDSCAGLSVRGEEGPSFFS